MAAWRECPRAKCISDLQAPTELCKTHALSIIHYQAQSDVEETVRLTRAFLVDLAALAPRVPAPLPAEAAQGHSPELSNPERASWANTVKQATQRCYRRKDVKRLAPASAAVARALQQRGREGAPTLPMDARPLAAPASGARGPALRGPPSASEIAAMYGHSDAPRTPTKRASVADDSGDLREFDLAPGGEKAEGDDAEYIAFGAKGAPPTPAAAEAKPAAAELKAKPAAADPGKFTGGKGRAFDCETEQLDSAMYCKQSHSVGLRAKGGSQLISSGGVRCAASKGYLLDIGRQVNGGLNAGKENREISSRAAWIAEARRPELMSLVNRWGNARCSAKAGTIGMSATAFRGLATSPVRGHGLRAALVPTEDETTGLDLTGMSKRGALMAGSPLFLTDLDAPMNFGEIQFVLSGPINGLFERLFETEAGPLFLNGVFFLTLMRMGVYYGFLQPAYLWHFQERYGQTWTVGHHLYGCSLPNPLKKGQ
ncbi:unnamed protein product [Prorocentrum cordatum]|uniref:Uncharacterized protein n=1 Tax=Prorocentrum cordatum TaxID=2364126 RepID=A0ABN9PVG6_9DINO|nr:unnamed protein product [Polarella glacialis]